MLFTTVRERKVMFVTLAMLTSCLVYEGEATEINSAIEEQMHFRAETIVYHMVNNVLDNVPSLIII